MSETLTLGQREAINNVILRCQDAPRQPWYCFNCLADLPTDLEAQLQHRCGEEDAAWLTGKELAALSRSWWQKATAMCLAGDRRLDGLAAELAELAEAASWGTLRDMLNPGRVRLRAHSNSEHRAVMNPRCEACRREMTCNQKAHH